MQLALGWDRRERNGPVDERETSTVTRRITRLIGIYNADGGVMGELRYVVGKARGRADCSLCDVTHRGVRTKSEWRGMCTRIGVPVERIHLNERDDEARRASDGRTPCVLAEVDGRLVLIMTSDDIDACDGSVSEFERRLADSMAEHDLGLASSGPTAPVEPDALGD